ncbi:MAG: hypothetical protein EPO55_00710 [Reyranella sp.]|uniref:hypothetical protein n=1 Tax=Reyranella sp. TaxID=1929291 RepID=UPI0011FA859C|nr:hypothetical protein [Reyranella sp.]TAJ42782.1 MAG: hypothetical protein EPO55_00710 [Reyranella sp.]
MNVTHRFQTAHRNQPARAGLDRKSHAILPFGQGPGDPTTFPPLATSRIPAGRDANLIGGDGSGWCSPTTRAKPCTSRQRGTSIWAALVAAIILSTTASPASACRLFGPPGPDACDAMTRARHAWHHQAEARRFAHERATLWERRVPAHGQWIIVRTEQRHVVVREPIPVQTRIVQYPPVHAPEVDRRRGPVQAANGPPGGVPPECRAFPTMCAAYR